MYSILLPTYNAEDTIHACLTNILSDILPDVSIVVVDNLSSDSTRDIILSYAAMYSSIHLIHETRRGVSHALNAGLRFISRGWVARIDADDLWLLGRDSLIRRTINNNPTPKTIFGTSCVSSLSDNTQKMDTFLSSERPLLPVEWSIHFYSPILHPTAFFKTEELLSLGGYPTQFPHCEDYNLWVNAYRSGFKFNCISTPTVLYTTEHQSPSNSTKRNLQLLGHDQAMYRAFVFTLGHAIRFDSISFLRALIVSPDYINITYPQIDIPLIHYTMNLVDELSNAVLTRYSMANSLPYFNDLHCTIHNARNTIYSVLKTLTTTMR